MNRRAFTLIEITVAVAIIAIVAALVTPVFSSAKEGAKIRSSLSRLHQLQLAVSIYRSDNESGSVTGSLPPYEYVYSSYLGLGQNFFKSPCGYRGIEPNRLGLSYQYAFVPDQDVFKYFEKQGEGSLIFSDASCNKSRLSWESSLSKKRGLGVCLDGRLINVYKTGFPGDLNWWTQ